MKSANLHGSGITEQETRFHFYDMKGVLQQKLVVIVQGSKHFPLSTHASAERKEAISAMAAIPTAKFCHPEKES